MASAWAVESSICQGPGLPSYICAALTVSQAGPGGHRIHGPAWRVVVGGPNRADRSIGVPGCLATVCLYGDAGINDVHGAIRIWLARPGSGHVRWRTEAASHPNTRIPTRGRPPLVLRASEVATEGPRSPCTAPELLAHDVSWRFPSARGCGAWLFDCCT
jgi:hypothetical protein